MATSHTTAVPFAVKTSTPDWMSIEPDEVESAFPDPHDTYIDWNDIFDSEIETPF